MTLHTLTAATILLLASSVVAASEPASTAPPKTSQAVPASTSAAGGMQSAGQGRSRDEVRAEAVEAVKHHRSTLAESLDLLKN